LFADNIRASSLHRLHQQAGQTTAPYPTPDHHFMLATREPSTEERTGGHAASPSPQKVGIQRFIECLMSRISSWPALTEA
jgi:hypothetical protein